MSEPSHPGQLTHGLRSCTPYSVLRKSDRASRFQRHSEFPQSLCLCDLLSQLLHSLARRDQVWVLLRGRPRSPPTEVSPEAKAIARDENTEPRSKRVIMSQRSVHVEIACITTHCLVRVIPSLQGRGRCTGLPRIDTSLPSTPPCSSNPYRADSPVDHDTAQCAIRYKETQ